MMKKKAKKSSGKKMARRRMTSKKNADPSKVREEIAGMVKSGAKGITKAVMGHAMQGELAPAKFLFEMAGVYPASTDGSFASAEEDCLAKTLLDRLNIPDDPVIADQVEGGRDGHEAGDASGEPGGAKRERGEDGRDGTGWSVRKIPTSGKSARSGAATGAVS